MHYIKLTVVKHVFAVVRGVITPEGHLQEHPAGTRLILPVSYNKQPHFYALFPSI